VHGLLTLVHQLSSWQIKAHRIVPLFTPLTMANVDAESVWHETIISTPVALFLIVHLNTPVHIAFTILISWIKDIKPDSVHIKPKIIHMVDQLTKGLTSLVCIGMVITTYKYIVIQI